MTSDADDYVRMQVKYYANESLTPEQIVGNYDYHENFPYETYLLYKNGDVRKPIFENFADKKAFDIGCGEGRMVRRMSKVFQSCDGADISEKMVNVARERCQGSKIYLSSGSDCGEAISDKYDFVFCTISLQHIASFTVRDQIFRDTTRILNETGCATFQLLMSEEYPFILRDKLEGTDTLEVRYNRDRRHAHFLDDDKFDAEATNSACDGLFGTRDILRIKSYFRTLFDHVQIWFCDISVGREARGLYKPQLETNHPNSHLHDGYHGTHFAFLHCSQKVASFNNC